MQSPYNFYKHQVKNLQLRHAEAIAKAIELYI